MSSINPPDSLQYMSDTCNSGASWEDWQKSVASPRFVLPAIAKEKQARHNTASPPSLHRQAPPSLCTHTHTHLPNLLRALFALTIICQIPSLFHRIPDYAISKEQRAPRNPHRVQVTSRSVPIPRARPIAISKLHVDPSYICQLPAQRNGEAHDVCDWDCPRHQLTWVFVRASV